MEVKGIVKNLTDYGAFVDLGGVDGLLHITDMAWKRVKHPSEIVNVGDEIPVKVVKFDREKQRVSLGLKQMGEDPWAAIASRYPEGARITGRVTNLTDYGCFVEIEAAPLFFSFSQIIFGIFASTSKKSYDSHPR